MPHGLWRRIGLALVVAFFTIGGIAHFVFAEAELSIMPAYVPYPVEMNYIAGFFEILGAVGLLIPGARRAAGFGLILLTICVTPANVYMLQHAEKFSGVPVWLLIVRLPVQALLILLIAWVSGVWPKGFSGCATKP